MASSKRMLKNRKINSDDYNNNDNDHNLDDEDDTESNYQKHNHLKQQQQLLVNNLSSGTNKTDLINQQQSHHMNCSNSSNTSTLLKQHQQRTPHHQPLIINNPNHMMMSVMNPLTINNTTHNSDMEFYTNMTTQQLFTNNSNANSDASCYNNNDSQNYQYGHQNHVNSFNNYNQQNSNYGHNIRTGSINEDHMSQTGDIASDLTHSAIQQANAAFNSPFVNNGNFIPTTGFNSNNNASNEPSFLRHTIRPKPIAIPINSTSSNSNQLNPIISMNSMEQQSMFSVNNSTRKSFKNLPMATATLISNQTNSTINFSDPNKQVTNGQKLHYTARPYIIDNQVQSSGEYSSHSPASSSHSGGQPQLYDKIGNVNTSNASTKSLLQPLKSFSCSTGSNTHNQIPPSSLSIPNTPAKYCDSNISFFLFFRPIKEDLKFFFKNARFSEYDKESSEETALSFIGTKHECDIHCHI